MKNPAISIIIPTYNREKLILKALDSAFNQTFQDFEIIVVDDASTDNTEQVIRNLSNEKIRYFKLNKNGGQCIARNYGIKQALGDYIAFLDSDDEWLPEKLSAQMECFIKGPKELGCVYGLAYRRDPVLDITDLIQQECFRGNIRQNLMNGFCPTTPSLFLVKKIALQEVDGFDEKLITFVDLDLWLRLSLKYHFDFVEKPLIIKYENIGDQYVNNFEKRYKGIKLFLNKWKNIVVQEMGVEKYRKFKKELTMALVIPMLENPPQNIRMNIFKIIGLQIDIRSTKFNQYVKSLMILLFGPNIISRIRKVKRLYSYNRKRDE
jgi:glycosyltransferase involved in cell wall biosynthesis